MTVETFGILGEFGYGQAFGWVSGRSGHQTQKVFNLEYFRIFEQHAHVILRTQADHSFIHALTEH